jgi:hypothetical protein
MAMRTRWLISYRWTISKSWLNAASASTYARLGFLYCAEVRAAGGLAGAI